MMLYIKGWLMIRYIARIMYNERTKEGDNTLTHEMLQLYTRIFQMMTHKSLSLLLIDENMTLIGVTFLPYS